MAPLGLVQVLRAKFWLASRAALVLTPLSLLPSCQMLRMPLYRTLYLGLIIGTMTFTLTALAVGLGALLPNFREDNPAKIVSGFGGTLCLGGWLPLHRRLRHFAGRRLPLGLARRNFRPLDSGQLGRLRRLLRFCGHGAFPPGPAARRTI